MADWNKPSNSSNYQTDVLANLKDRDTDASTLLLSDPINPITGMIRYNRTANAFQEWNGTAWVNKILSVAGGGTGTGTTGGIVASLGLGTMSTQNSNAVNITGGNISGVPINIAGASGVLGLANGGTGSSLALGPYASVLMSNGIGNVIFGTDGRLLDSLNASNLAFGTVPEARLPASAVQAPTGCIFLWAVGGTTAPTGYLICNGQAVSRTTYATLYALIGTYYGAGDNSTTFNIPNLNSKVPIGYDGSIVFGTRAGSVNHTHTFSSSGSTAHSHSVSLSAGSHNHGVGTLSLSGAGTSLAVGGQIGGTDGNNYAFASINHGHNLTGGLSGATATEPVTVSGQTSSSGVGTISGTTDAATIPYIVLNYIIKI